MMNRDPSALEILLSAIVPATPGLRKFFPYKTAVRAKSFLVPADVTMWLAERLDDDEIADLVIAQERFARPPFPETYVEMDMGVLGGPADGSLTGVFIADNRMYLLRGYWSDEDSRHVDVLGGWLDFLTGDTTISPGYETLAAWNTMTDAEIDTDRAKMSEALRTMYRMTQFFFLLLHREKVRTISTTAPKSIQRRGKRLHYMSSRTVTIDLFTTKEVKRQFYTGGKVPPVAHEVRGHWMNFNRRPGCDHQFEEVLAEDGQRILCEGTGLPRRYRCGRCGQLRSWRREYQKGDASVGFSLKEPYQIAPIERKPDHDRHP